MSTLLRTTILCLVLSPVAALARWPGMTTGSWNRPNEDLTSVAPDAVAFSSLAIWADRSGAYELSSLQHDFDGFLAVYAGRFDPTAPLNALIAANDDGPAGNGSSHTTLSLVEGVIYHLVTSGKQAGEAGEFELRADGPGTARPVACFVGDEPYFSDDVPLASLSLLRDQFCVAVDWRDFRGNAGFGKPVGHRSEDSGMFWFFSRNNWELMVKVLDGCAINNHYWVFMAATTNVEFNTVVYKDIGSPEGSMKTYQNPLGVAAPAVTDTSAFSCP